MYEFSVNSANSTHFATHDVETRRRSPDITVIVPTHNRAASFPALLDSLCTQEAAEVIE
jgi:hypothetical protein